MIEIATDFADVQERACETLCALIRKCGGLPNVSSFIKVDRNVAHEGEFIYLISRSDLDYI